MLKESTVEKSEEVSGLSRSWSVICADGRMGIPQRVFLNKMIYGVNTSSMAGFKLFSAGVSQALDLCR